MVTTEIEELTDDQLLDALIEYQDKKVSGWEWVLRELIWDEYHERTKSLAA
ncbi:MAG: hypothetical protein ACYS30_19685 [Planctomycetota bacterium]|jgi:hypothetical protein